MKYIFITVLQQRNSTAHFIGREDDLRARIYTMLLYPVCCIYRDRRGHSHQSSLIANGSGDQEHSGVPGAMYVAAR